MHYDSELNYLKKICQKIHIHVTELSKTQIPDIHIDFGLRQLVHHENVLNEFLTMWSDQKLNSNTIYKVTDGFSCRYFLMLLPCENEDKLLIIGPFLPQNISHEQILEIAEKFSVLPQEIKLLEGCYYNVPIVQNWLILHTAVNVFGETVWGSGSAFDIVDVSEELISPVTVLSTDNIGGKERDVIFEMQHMESRYAFENELIEMVSRGQSNRAALMIQSFTANTFERRVANPLRNIKNYCIICNTLFRKAAEQGGVHPIYLDRISSDFARRNELLSDVESARNLMSEMIYSYCRLVRKHSTKQYSSPIQKAMAYIDADLSGDLSLHALAAAQGISNSYLSALFKKETGQTVTDYVNQKRVNRASHLLGTTKLQIQTIAQHCGISDVNYFSKIFKKYTGMTPKEYRKKNQHIIIKTE